MAHEPQGKKFEVAVVYNGVTKPLEVVGSESVEAVLARAINLFPVTEQRHLLALFDETGTEISDEKQSAIQAGLRSGSKVALRQGAVKGG